MEDHVLKSTEAEDRAELVPHEAAAPLMETQMVEQAPAEENPAPPTFESEAVPQHTESEDLPDAVQDYAGQPGEALPTPSIQDQETDQEAALQEEPDDADNGVTEVDQRLKSAIESLLFIAGNPVSLDRLAGIFEDATREQLVTQIDILQQEYEARGSGIMLAEVAGGYQLVTRPENAVWIRKFRAVKVSTKLSRPALETLAIVAYKQPITRAEVEAVRGVNIGGIMRNLMERRLVKIVGKKDVPGKPMMYGTSLEFLQYFGLKDLSALPTLKEFQELEAGDEVMEEASADSAEITTAEDEAFIEAAAAEAATEGNVTG